MEKPQIIKAWEESIKQIGRPPAVCWNCEYHNRPNGVCDKYGMVPPKDFAETPGACGDWLEEIPF